MVRSVWQRLVGSFLSLPESCANCARFRVFFLLPRWFRMPAKVRVAKRSIALSFPRETGVESDFITCFLRNTYGLGRRLREVRTILDIGANAGFFSLAAREYYPEAVIHAYEPNPRILPFLSANTAGLGIRVYPEAVSDQSGFAAMIDTGPSNAARTRTAEDASSGIRQISLATAMERMGGAVDLLKLDCEGAEWEMLRLDGCWDSVRNIRMEYHLFHGETVEQMREALRSKGFRVIHTGSYNEVGGTIWASRAE